MSSTRATISTRASRSSETKTITTATSRQSSGTARTRRRRSNIPSSQASTYVPSRIPPGNLGDDGIRRRNSHARTSTSTSTTCSSTSSSSSSSSHDLGFLSPERQRARRKYLDEFLKQTNDSDFIREQKTEQKRKKRKERHEIAWRWYSAICGDRSKEDRGRRRRNGRGRSKSIDIDDISGGMCCIFF